MKQHFYIIVILLSLFLVSCDENPIEPINNNINGSYKSVKISCTELDANYHYYGSTYNSYTGNSQYDYGKVEVWNISDEFYNQDSNFVEIKNNKLTFFLDYKYPYGYANSISKLANIYFDKENLIIDSLSIITYKHYQAEPQHMSRLSESGANSSLKLYNIPLQIEKNKTIKIVLNKEKFLNCKPKISNRSWGYTSDYGTVSYSNSNTVEFVDIKNLPDSFVMEIEIK